MTVSKCIGAIVARNEAGADRYLKRVLANAKQFCDEIVVLDDASTDDTVAVCKAAGATVYEREVGGGWWGGVVAQNGEANARATLWQKAVERADNGWVYVFDADHELIGISPRDFRRLLSATNVNAWACPLFDCWGDDEHHRIDGYWQAWRSPRVWLARAISATSWSGRDIHAGHLPPGVEWHVGLMPSSCAVRHLGYIEEKHRVTKHKKYLQLAQ